MLLLYLCLSYSTVATRVGGLEQDMQQPLYGLIRPLNRSAGLQKEKLPKIVIMCGCNRKLRRVSAVQMLSAEVTFDLHSWSRLNNQHQVFTYVRFTSKEAVTPVKAPLVQPEMWSDQKRWSQLVSIQTRLVLLCMALVLLLTMP